MRISNTSLRTTTLCAIGLALPLAADDLTLLGGASHLTGSVRSIDEAGRVELASPLSPEPLLLKGGAVEKVEFSSERETEAPPPALIELANGDLLPATLTGLDDRTLTVISPVAGALQISRDHLTSMQLGIRRRNVVYQGPVSLNEWTSSWGDPKNWSFRNHALVANGPATAARKLSLPRQFTLRFTLKWQARQVPNFQIHFADPLAAKGKASDRYYLQFGGAGLEVKREAAEGKRYNTIAQLNRMPNQYPDQQLHVEIRVDRKGSRLHLFINGEPEGDFADPISPVPDGSGITLMCNAPSGTTQEITAIEVCEFDDSRARHHAEERGAPETDSMISREEDRWGGRLIDLRQTGDGPVFRFKSDFQDAPLEIPEAEVSTVFFATKDDAAKDDAKAPFVLKLPGEGSLKVSACRFDDGKVSATHPLLGPLELRRDGVLSMERTNPNPEPADEP